MEVYIIRSLIHKISINKNGIYVLFNSGNELMYTINNKNLLKDFEMPTENILQNKYMSCKNDFQLVRDQLLPKPNLR